MTRAGYTAMQMMRSGPTYEGPDLTPVGCGWYSAIPFSFPGEAAMTILAALLLLAGAALPPSAGAQTGYDEAAVATCREFVSSAHRVTDGVASSVFQIELEMRGVYRQAERSSDRILQQKAGALVSRAATFARDRSAEPMGAAIQDFLGYCMNTVLRGPATTIHAPRVTAPTLDPPRAPAKPLTREEVEQQTKRATEQSGSKCQTKTYGGGAAVTVCD